MKCPWCKSSKIQMFLRNITNSNFLLLMKWYRKWQNRIRYLSINGKQENFKKKTTPMCLALCFLSLRVRYWNSATHEIVYFPSLCIQYLSIKPTLLKNSSHRVADHSSTFSYNSCLHFLRGLRNLISMLYGTVSGST